MNQSRRRIVTAAAAASLLAAPFVRAQKGKVAHVVLAENMPRRPRETLVAALAKAGFTEGQNLRIEQVEVFGAPPERAEPRARQVIASRPDVIFMRFCAETEKESSTASRRDAPSVHLPESDCL